jgi:hypothetical protein
VTSLQAGSEEGLALGGREVAEPAIQAGPEQGPGQARQLESLPEAGLGGHLPEHPEVHGVVRLRLGTRHGAILAPGPVARRLEHAPTTGWEEPGRLT